MIGKMYEARKQTQGTNNQYVQAKSENGQNVHFQSQREIRDGTSGQIGKEFGIDGKTVRRAEHFAKGVDKVREVNQEAADKILRGESGVLKCVVPDMKSASRSVKQKNLTESRITQIKALYSIFAVEGELYVFVGK